MHRRCTGLNYVPILRTTSLTGVCGREALFVGRSMCVSLCGPRIIENPGVSKYNGGENPPRLKSKVFLTMKIN